MSKVEKLTVQGIRSFGGQEREKITFGTPLTLIVGQNGTGKTTIIECLKYATTGDLPPNSKGGAFVHDPVLDASREAMGQVKLAFRSINGDELVCTRSMQLQIKKTARTFKTLEGQLMAHNERTERTTVVSSKCVELDSQIPLLLGASKSILENVIFCHQEDSLWPLAEPSVVKKRFDDIFEAAKFTKALDSIKSIRKEYTVDLKLLKQTTEHLQQDKERADRAKQKRSLLQERIEGYQAETAQIQKQMHEVEEQQEQLFKTNQEFQETLARLRNLKSEHVSIIENIDRLKSAIKEPLDGHSLQDLQEMLDNFASRTSELISNKTTLEEQLSMENQNIEKDRTLLIQLTTTKAQLESEQKQLDTLLDSALQFAAQKATELKLSENGQGANGFDKFVNALQTLNEEALQDLQSVRSSAKEAEDKISTQIQSANGERRFQEDEASRAHKRIQDTEAKIEDVSAKIQALQRQSALDAGTVAVEQEQIKELEEKLQKYEETLKEKDFSGKITNLEDEMQQIDIQINRKKKSIAQYRELEEQRKLMEFLLNEVKKKKLTLSSTIESMQSEYKSAIGIDIKESADEDVLEVQTKLKQKIDQKSEQISLEGAKVSSLQTKCAMAESQISEKRAQLASIEAEVTEVLGDRDYESALAENDENLHTAIQNVETIGFTIDYTNQAIATAEKHQACVLCRHDFGDEELDEFLARMRSRKRQAESMGSEEAKQEEQELLKEQELLRSIAPKVKMIDNLKSDLDTKGELLANKSRIESDYEDAESRLVTLQVDRQELQSQLDEVMSLSKFAADTSRSFKDILSMEKQIEELKEFPGLSNSSLDEFKKIEDDLESLVKRQQHSQQSMRDLIDEREKMRAEMFSLQSRANKKKATMSEIEEQIRSKNEMTAQLAEAKAILTSAKEEKRTAQGMAAQTQETIKELQAIYNELRSTNVQAEKMASESYLAINESQTEAKSLQKRISDLENSGIDSKLDGCVEQVREVELRLSTLEKDRESTLEEINNARALVVNASVEERNIRDNLDVRRLEEQLQTNREVIAELESKNAEAEAIRYTKRTQELREQHGSLTAQYSGRIGEIKQMTDQVTEINRELTTEFADVYTQYSKSKLELNAKTLANDDLGKYSRALDSAIMKYHALKMQEINQIIDELWKKTYTGTDIDSIAILSSDENTKGNRSYNYRVVMRKGEIELDMRGRCSAGQKVLASIIIRLALSECFGTNCGLIALDEPTTNLDIENIESLAKALSGIIEARSSQENFQLIIITHDEKFLADMESQKYADHFYRVHRDDQQLSKIEWVPIGQVMGD